MSSLLLRVDNGSLYDKYKPRNASSWRTRIFETFSSNTPQFRGDVFYLNAMAVCALSKIASLPYMISHFPDPADIEKL